MLKTFFSHQRISQRAKWTSLEGGPSSISKETYSNMIFQGVGGTLRNVQQYCKVVLLKDNLTLLLIDLPSTPKVGPTSTGLSQLPNGYQSLRGDLFVLELFFVSRKSTYMYTCQSTRI